jgi:predicted transcriptional regulator
MSRQDRAVLVIRAIQEGASTLAQISQAIGLGTSHTKVPLKELSEAGQINREIVSSNGNSVVYKYSPIQSTNEQI